MIYERLMRVGSFNVPLKVDAPYGLWATVKPVAESGGGHIVITPQRLDPRLIGDTGMLAAATYAGPVLQKAFTRGAFTISGAGMGWWLGDDLASDVYETAVTLTSATLSTSLTALLPSAITSGTVTNTGSNFTGTFHYDMPRDAIASLMATTRAEYRINPDGTMDAAANTDLFTIDTPTVVVTRYGSGSDPSFTGVPVSTVKSLVDTRSYATRAVQINADELGELTEHATATQSPAPSGKDIHGNTIVRTLVYTSPPGDSVTAGQFLVSELGEYLPILESSITTEFWELSGGKWSVGDSFWIYDDPAFVDTSNQIRFRGDVIHPKKMRLLEASWPLVDGMGVSFRDDTGAYTDLTDWVAWEATDGSPQDTPVVGGRQGVTTLKIREFVERSSV